MWFSGRWRRRTHIRRGAPSASASAAAQLASLSFDADTLLGVLSSGFGRLLGLRLAGALMLWALLALESPWPILALGAVLALVDGAGGHAIRGLPGLGPALDATHVGA